jgi:hypothetical protein
VGELVGIADHVDAYHDTVRDVEDERGIDAPISTMREQSGAAVEPQNGQVQLRCRFGDALHVAHDPVGTMDRTEAGAGFAATVEVQADVGGEQRQQSVDLAGDGYGEELLSYVCPNLRVGPAVRIGALCLPSHLDLRPVGVGDERHQRATSALSTDES